MPEVWCVRAEGGKYAEDFVKGGYAAIGWGLGDLSRVTSRDEIEQLYKEEYAQHSALTAGQNIGQIWRFVREMTEGEYVITPDPDTELLWWGIVGDRSYYYEKKDDGCPFPHRKSVKWNRNPVRRNVFSVPFQNSIRSTLTVFWIKHKNDFFNVIGRQDLRDPEETKIHQTSDKLVLNKILGLTAEEFELLVTNLLSSLGFEARHTGRTGDGGVDATGELDLYGLAKINIFVQAKRYALDSRIAAKDVKHLRQNIPTGAQGAFITTCEFREDALKAATELGFPRIGTVNGQQLVDLLSEKWDELPEGIRQKLGLKRSLVVD